MPHVQFRATEPVRVSGRTGRLGLPGVDSIGMGYDVFQGLYASPKATTRLLFDLGPVEDFEIPEGAFAKPARVGVQAVQSGGLTRTEGKTSREYQSQVAVAVGLQGSYGFFSGSLDAEFSRNERRCTTYHFISQTDTFHKYLLTLVPPGALRETVQPSVRADLDALPPAQLFDTYGTHFLRSLIIGATSVFSSAVNTAEYSSAVSVSAALGLQYKMLTSGISSTLTAQQKDAIAQLSSSSHQEVFVQGGRAELAHGILEGSYGPWIESIPGNMAFVGLTRDSLQPIWSLCDGSRAEALEAAYAQYAGAHPPDVDPDIIRIHHYSTNVVKSRHYYSQYPDDFPDKDWQLADGAFTFFAFKDAADDRIPIYLHESANAPRRFKLSLMRSIGHGWQDASRVAFYAYRDRGEGRVAVFSFVADDGKDSAYHGWLYTTGTSVKGWVRQQPEFYVPALR